MRKRITLTLLLIPLAVFSNSLQVEIVSPDSSPAPASVAPNMTVDDLIQKTLRFLDESTIARLVREDRLKTVMDLAMEEDFTNASLPLLTKKMQELVSVRSVRNSDFYSSLQQLEEVVADLPVRLRASAVQKYRSGFLDRLSEYSAKHSRKKPKYKWLWAELGSWDSNLNLLPEDDSGPGIYDGKNEAYLVSMLRLGHRPMANSSKQWSLSQDFTLLNLAFNTYKSLNMIEGGYLVSYQRKTAGVVSLYKADVDYLYHWSSRQPESQGYDSAYQRGGILLSAQPSTSEPLFPFISRDRWQMSLGYQKRMHFWKSGGESHDMDTVYGIIDYRCYVNLIETNLKYEYEAEKTRKYWIANSDSGQLFLSLARTYENKAKLLAFAEGERRFYPSYFGGWLTEKTWGGGFKFTSAPRRGFLFHATVKREWRKERVVTRTDVKLDDNADRFLGMVGFSWSQ